MSRHDDEQFKAELTSLELAALREERDSLRAQLAAAQPPPNWEGSTHWETCWQARGHHDCAIARVNELASHRVPEDAELDALVWSLSLSSSARDKEAHDAITALRRRVALMEHTIWHALDDSETREDEIALTVEHAEALGNLVGEEHPLYEDDAIAKEPQDA